MLYALLAVAASAQGLPAYQVGILRHPAVQADLGLSAQQKRRVVEILDAAKREYKRVARPGAPRASYDHVLSLQKQALPVLTTSQKARLHQISLRLLSPFVLTDPGIAKQVGLTESQRRRLEMALNRAAEKVAGASTAPKARTGAKLDKVAEPLLTPAQREKWKQMLGKPFDVGRLARP
jgi:hypothetical protein